MNYLIVFRVDASSRLGIGHLARCMTLAGEWRRRGARCIFLMRDRLGAPTKAITDAGYDLYLLDSCQIDEDWLGVTLEQELEDVSRVLSSLPTRPTWLVVDHYGIYADWHQAMQGLYDNLLVIDDLFDRPIVADLVLNQNLGVNKEFYCHLTTGAEILIGTGFALLRPEFSVLRPRALARRDNPGRHILISLGGSDPLGLTASIVQALVLEPACKPSRITVVLGPAAGDQRLAVNGVLHEYSGESEVLVDVPNMAALMADADLAVGAAGSSSWERCCLGLPSITIVLADNQAMTADKLSACGASFSLSRLSISSLGRKVTNLLDRPITLRNMSQRAAAVTDGLGSERVVDFMVKMSRRKFYA